MSHRFTIEITEHVPVVRKGRDWLKVADTGNEKDGGPIYAYIDVDVEKIEDRVILKMELDTIVIEDVVRALLGLDDG